MLKTGARRMNDTIIFKVTQEVKDSVENALALFWKGEPTSALLDKWAGGNFIQSNDELTLFLRVCGEAYAQKNTSFFIQLGKAMRREPASSPISQSTETFNNQKTWLLVGWAGVEFAESILKRKTLVSEEELTPFKDAYHSVTPNQIPLCFYSIRALYQLRYDVLRLHPQTSEDDIKKTIQRLGLKRPPGAPWVHRVECDDTGRIYQYRKNGDTF